MAQMKYEKERSNEGQENALYGETRGGRKFQRNPQKSPFVRGGKGPGKRRKLLTKAYPGQYARKGLQGTLAIMMTGETFSERNSMDLEGGTRAKRPPGHKGVSDNTEYQNLVGGWRGVRKKVDQRAENS